VAIVGIQDSYSFFRCTHTLFGMFSQLEINRATAKIIYVYTYVTQAKAAYLWLRARGRGWSDRMCVRMGFRSGDVAIDAPRADVDAFQLNKSPQINWSWCHIQMEAPSFESVY